MKIVIMTVKSWNIENAVLFSKLYPNIEILLISDSKDANLSKIEDFSPRYIFVIHWSWYIPPEIYECYESIVFHPTALPYGRGGSPIQNLIVRGFGETTISAVRIGEELDAGNLYPVSRKLYLQGSVEEILINMSKIVCFDMIPEIIKQMPIPYPQEGETVVFKRKKPEESSLDFSDDLNNIYDKIRMLDGEGYPVAFLEIGNYRLEFKRASLIKDGILSDVVIREKNY